MLQKRFSFAVLATFALAILAANVASAQNAGPMIPDSISFQGSVTNLAGIPLNTTVSMQFTLFTASGLTAWTETQSSIEIKNGIFNVVLGRNTGLDDVVFDEPLKLGVKIQGQSVSESPLSSAPYALGVRGFYSYPSASVGADTSMNVVAGASNNKIDPSAVGATISGGGGVVSGLPEPNKATSAFATVSGGHGNSAEGVTSTIGGGSSNTVQGTGSVVAGGQNNSATVSFTVVAGGSDNEASGLTAAVAGGNQNKASGQAVFIGGGFANQASGGLSVIPGGTHNATRGNESFAAGSGAKANHDNSFVWAGKPLASAADTFATSAARQFLINASGGVGIGTNKPGAALHVKQSTSWIGGGLRLEDASTDTTRWDIYVDAQNDLNFAYIDTLKSFIFNGDGSFNQFSDARLKTDVHDVNPVLRDVLNLRPRSYRYLDNPAGSTPSIGFIAQDVERVFPDIVREKNGMKSLAYSDFAVLAIKAIQEQQVLIEELQREVALLKNRP